MTTEVSAMTWLKKRDKDLCFIDTVFRKICDENFFYSFSPNWIVRFNWSFDEGGSAVGLEGKC